MSAKQDQADMVDYKGNCHCGAFKFTLKLTPLGQVNYCNCSICARNAYLWVFPASSSHLTVEKGEGTLKAYEFGKRSLQHYFCPTCGTSIMGRRSGAPDGQALAVNARSFQDIDIDALKVQPFDGGSLEPAYQPPREFPTLKSEVDPGLKLYHGNCHCGAVTWTVKHQPLEESEVITDNCSWCRRNGEMWIYPPPENLALRHGGAFTAYEFGLKRVRHLFCSTCGVSVGCVPKEELEAQFPVRPLNVRTMNGVDLDGLKVQKRNGWSEGEPQYEVK